MENDTVRRIEAQGPGSILEEIARRGAQQMLAEAMEAEVAGFLAQHAEKRDENGHRVVVRNGHMPARELITGIGRIPIEQPRVDDRQLAKEKEPRFSSAILPRYLKRVPSVDSLIPALYLKGVSTGDFSQALEAILGKQAPGLSANSVVRLKAVWEQEYQQWTRRDLSAKRYVYFWADGLHVNVRLDEERSCILVIMRSNSCWFHKAGNVLDKMPKSVQGRAKTMIREMWQGPRWRRPRAPMISFARPGRRSTRRRSNACAKMRDRCSASIRFLPRTGHTCGPATRSSPPTRRCDCARSARRAAARGRRR